MNGLDRGNEIAQGIGNELLHVVDAGEVGIAVLDSKGLVRVWNAWMARASGIRATDALGRDLFALLKGKANPALAESVSDTAKWGTSAVLSSSLHEHLLPFTSSEDGGHRQMEQKLVIKPLLNAGHHGRADGRSPVLLQVSDLTHAHLRERTLSRQAKAMEALAESYRLSELHTRSIVEHTAEAIITYDETGRIESFNPSASAIFGYPADAVLGKPIGGLITELDGATWRVGRPPQGRHQSTGIGTDGNRFPIALSVSPMEVGGRRLNIALAHDITDRLTAEAEMRDQKEWLDSLFNAMPDVACFKDGESRWLMANDHYIETFGLRGIEWRGKRADEIEGLNSRVRTIMLESLLHDEKTWRKGQRADYTKPVATATGERMFEFFKVPLHNPDGSRKGLVVVGRDITEHRAAAQRIEHLAHHDALTGLPNRSLLQQRLKQSVSNAKRSKTRLAFMMLDLDKFKEVNDTLGHGTGDALLVAVAERLRRCLRETDTVARLGGDEFAIILTNLAEVDGAGRVAETIIEAMAEPFDLSGTEIRTSTSIGITIHPEDADHPAQLMRFADLALYRSKAEGRNTYKYYVEQMNREVQARQSIEKDFRDALGGLQLHVMYQPLIDLKTEAITGAEALVRWTHPERGPVSPAEFIPIVERTDLIYPLGRWVMLEACKQVRAWQDAGLPPLTVAVNLSPAQFKNQDLVATVREVLEESRIDPRLLQLEITEGIAMHNVDATIDTLGELRDLGCTISIDDFGTGYSSLSYLKRFPADKLKIDRSFVIDLGTTPTSGLIMAAVVQLGHSIGTKVNCEGIETIEQVQAIRKYGVDEAQGFYFARPMAAHDFAFACGGNYEDGGGGI